MHKISQINIKNRIISEKSPCFIIAEGGVNHNGRLDIALKMVDVAADAGADAIKFMIFKAGQVVTESVSMASYQKKNIGKSGSQFSLLKKLELKDDMYRLIIERCKKRNIIFILTPHGGFESIDFFEKLKISVFKFGSGDLTNLPVLEYAAKFNKPMILGTGMADMSEVKKAVSCIKKAGNNKIIVLHCTTNYPCASKEVNLRAMQKMQKELGVLVGYSDHTLGLQVPIMATTLGACVIEKHFTLDKKMRGPDHKASLDPKELEEMVKSIRKVDTILGNSKKGPTLSELKHIPLVRKSVVAKEDIKKGNKFDFNNLAIKRPGTGLKPEFFLNIIGKISKNNIKKDTLITKKDFINV